MATQDVLTTAITSLMELANPTANAAQIEQLQATIASLQQQLAQAQAQLQALQGNDGQTAQKVLQGLRRLANGGGGVAGPDVATAVKGAFTAATPVANAALTTAAAAQTAPPVSSAPVTAPVSATPSASS